MAEQRLQRRLAAILSADVVGYSRLMGGDEAGTLARLKAVRRDLIDPLIAAHSGRTVKLMGDGALVEFGSAVDVVACAIAIQKDLGDHDAVGPADSRIQFRIGINVGDVIIDDSDIFGDGVKISARIETLAEPGGVSVSEDAWRQVQGKVAVNVVDLGPQNLKNIERPVRIFRLELGAGGVRTTATVSTSAPPDKPSIAVLAFQNMSGDPEQEYFADGITEDVITDLSKIGGLMVIARNSSFAYKGKAGRHPSGGPRTRRPLCARRQHPPIWRPGQDHRAADRCGNRRAPLGRPLRSRAQRHLRRSGRGHAADRRRPEDQTEPARSRDARRRRNDQQQGARLFPGSAARRCRRRSGTARRSSGRPTFLNKAIGEDPDYGEPYAGLAHWPKF